MEIKKGSLIKTAANSYVLRKQLGSGGNGQVWLGKSSGDSKDYAIKFLNKCDDTHKTKRFMEEIKFCETTDNSHVIHIGDHGNIDGQLFYVMPVYKKTLSDIIKQESNYAVLLSYLSALCEAIKHIHSNNVIHRDIKPENILISETGTLVLADFGIAHFIDSTLTKPKDWLANKAYAAPEQMIKGNALQITNACDIYALGAIINEMFTKQKPAGSQFATISDIYPFLHSLDHTVTRCLSQCPEDRPSIDEVLTDIKLLEGSLTSILEDINNVLLSGEIPNLPQKIITAISAGASVDVLSAKYILENWSDERLKRLNHNYHLNINYQMDETLKNAYFQRQLLKVCKKYFNYESSSYANNSPYTPLNLSAEPDIKIYQTFEAIVKRTKLPSNYYDYSGRILKFFSSCCDYHCKEILSAIPRLESDLTDLMRAPIIYLIIRLRDVFSISDFEEYDILDHLVLDWSHTTTALIEEPNLYIQESDNITTILNNFQEKWTDAIFSKIDATHYTVRFKTSAQFIQFRNFALDLAKPYYVFEGDVLDLMRVNREYDDIIELIPWSEFDITCTLAKIVGLREDF